MDPISEGKLSKKVALNLLYSFSVGFLLFLTIYGFYVITLRLQIEVKISYIVMVFAVLFILSSVILEHRGGRIPRLFVGSVVISALLTFFIVCIVNGIFAILNNNRLPLDTFLVVYSLCSVAAFIGLRISKI